MSLRFVIDGQPFDAWTSASISRDMNDLAGAFSIVISDATRSLATLPYASFPSILRARPGQAVMAYADDELCLVGWVDKISPDIDGEQASVTLEGRDKTGDLVDSAALVEGAAEYKNVKLEDAAGRIAKPFGLSVKCDIDSGDPFLRYSLDLSETAKSAIEKGCRSRHAFVLSDGVGGLVITRTGKMRAPDGLRLPGNVLRAGGSFDWSKRQSETIVRGQREFAGKDRTAEPLVTPAASPVNPDAHEPGDGSATETERKGTVATGRAKDDEITRYRPIVHLARSKAETASAQEEADWRMRTKRGESEEHRYTVRGHSANGRMWRINELAAVEDEYLGVNRDMLISKVEFRQDSDGAETDLTVISPEAFDKVAVGARRTNAPASRSKATGSLDSTAERL